MLEKRDDTWVEQRHPKRIVHLPLQDKGNSHITNSSTGDDVEQHSEVFATPFLPPSSHTDQSSSNTDQLSSPLHREDEFELPTSFCAHVCARENPDRGRPQHRGRGRPKGRSGGGIASRGGGNAAGGDGRGDGDNDAG